MLELFSSKTCQYCEQVRDRLDLDGLEYVEHDVDDDRRARERLTALVGSNAMVPVLVDDGRVVQVGVDGRGCYVSAG